MFKEIVKFTYSKSPSLRSLSGIFIIIIIIVRTLIYIKRKVTFYNELGFYFTVNDIMALTHSSYIPIACFGLDV